MAPSQLRPEAPALGLFAGSKYNPVVEGRVSEPEGSELSGEGQCCSSEVQHRPHGRCWALALNRDCRDAAFARFHKSLGETVEVDLLRRRICCPTEAADFLADLQVSWTHVSTGGSDHLRWKMLGPELAKPGNTTVCCWCLSQNTNLCDRVGFVRKRSMMGCGAGRCMLWGILEHTKKLGWPNADRVMIHSR